MTAPVSSLADFVPPDTVLPFTPGAVSVTSSSRFLGTSTLMTYTDDHTPSAKAAVHYVLQVRWEFF